jgi:hypothetical protein
VPGCRAKGRKTRTVTTALGPVTLTREYSWHAVDGGAFRADGVLGLDGFLTCQARRLITLAGVEHSFARAQQVLHEMCGWQVDDEVIRQTTHAEARRASHERPARSDAAAFATAPGEVEVLMDAGKVNTRDGWRDIKMGLFLRRNAGSPALPTQWDRRLLPAPTIRTTIAAIEEADLFGPRLRTEADRLGVTTLPALTVLADGGEWIWNQAAEHLPQASGVLDIYHALEHVSDAVKAVWGVGADANAARIDAGRRALLADGKAGVDRWLAGLFGEVPPGVSADPLLALAAYLAKHPTRLNYRERLAEGRSIGSGAVEGAIKQQVNLRLKRTGARWRVEHVGPLVELRALSHTPAWQDLWNAA